MLIFSATSQRICCRLIVRSFGVRSSSRIVMSHRVLPAPACRPLAMAVPAAGNISTASYIVDVSRSVFDRGNAVRSLQIHVPGCRYMRSFSPLRWIRNSALMKRRSALNNSKPLAEKSLELDVDVSIEEGVSVDEQILNTAEMLRLNAPMAMKVALHGLKDTSSKTRETSVDDLGNFVKAELSILLCNDDFIRQLNKQLRKVDSTTDVLSIPQHIPGYQFPILMLGDIVISIDTAARQAEERGHNLLDEIRILMVHGLLHLLGYDHEKSKEAEIEMEKEEEIILKVLQWKGKGLIHSTRMNSEGTQIFSSTTEIKIDNYQQRQHTKASSACRPKFKYLLCDMDGTLLNSQSRVTSRTAQALKEAIAQGVNVIIATGKARTAVIDAFKPMGLAGDDGVISHSLPGVFLQGLLVYGKQGIEIHRSDLDPLICNKAFQFSLENQIPLVGFSEDRVVTLFNHPLIDKLHTVYLEPKAEVIPSLNDLLASARIQKLLLIDSAEKIQEKWRPHWSLATEDKAHVVQALPEMLEILPAGASKGVGVQKLLDHLGVNADEVMAIGDGENDVEMLQLVRWAVVMANGSEKAKNVADAMVTSNDDDGVADAIYQFVL
eukprot:TRINITY_DN2223_c0_g1_i1.p1 TRINITY_DN2223_c0_g1~~TRINITY_DN2223_c0_g1_i1.p1  ORF type:complete len:607 (+),score=124.05 TRINITY_DN2223_c0_g1_i1:171-1991(+)